MNGINNSESSWKSTFTYAKAAAATLGLTFLHECGHALAATALYKNADPEISFSFDPTLSWFSFGGRCKYTASTLSALGKRLGSSNSEALVAAAGPATDIISLLALSKLTGGDRQTAQLLSLKAINLSLYALSALWDKSRGHDFHHVWTQGGFLAYSLLTVSCLATTVLVLRNAAKSPNEETQKASSRDFYRARRIDPIHYPFRPPISTFSSDWRG